MMASQTRKRMTPTGKAPGPDAASGTRHELLAGEVLDKAALLFASKGFAATSLKDVADAVGLSRSSIYYYYPNKDALLAELIAGVTLPVAAIFREVERQDLAPLPRIREVVRRLVLWVADPHTHFRLMDQSEAALPPAIAMAHKDAKRQVLAEMVTLIDAAVAAGDARAIDTRVTALSVIGMAMWTAWWFQPRPGQALESVADTIADNAIASVRRVETSQPRATIGGLADTIRDNLALIERMAGTV